MTVEKISEIIGILFAIGVFYLWWKPSKKEITSFWKYFFHWKYIVFIIMLILIAYLNTMLFNIQITTDSLKGSPLFFLIITTIALRRYKGVFWKKILMFILYAITTVGIYLSSIDIFYNLEVNANNRIINNILKQNKNMPKMANENTQILKYSSKSSDNITMHLKFISYDKQSILKEFTSLNDFGNYMLKEELKSCATPNMEEMLKYGLTMNIVYYDKNNNEISKILINKELCKPYYKNN